MARSRWLNIVSPQQRLAGTPSHAGVGDADLLARFVTQRDEAAFELLVWRHGPMVFNLCRRLLRDLDDAEDAFQAAFTTLALRAGTISKQQAVSSWLYAVAYHCALRVRTRAQRRAAREEPLGPLGVAWSGLGPEEEAAWKELRTLLDDEVRRLPEKYRAVFVLCYLQGRTNEEAAAELGCPAGTVMSRLARARARLQRRLARLDFMLGILPFGVLLEHKALELPVPAGLVAATLEAVGAGRKPEKSRPPRPAPTRYGGRIANLLAATLALLALAVGTASAFVSLTDAGGWGFQTSAQPAGGRGCGGVDPPAPAPNP
jgi:RNA polymerase sigma factor (sigma-70 family)